MFTKFMQFIYYTYSWFIITACNSKAEKFRFAILHYLLFLFSSSSYLTIDFVHILMHIHYGEMHAGASLCIFQIARFLIGYNVIRHSSQCQRAPDSDYKSIFPRAKADVYIMTDVASVVVDNGGTDKSIKWE